MRTLSLLLSCSFLLVAACSKDSPPAAQQEEPVRTSPAAEEARQLFNTVCATCHGTDGTGNGAAAANLNPKPRNYTDKAWQAATTDDQIRNIILLGGAGVGKSALMPAQTQLKDKPLVVEELVHLVRSFGK
ncbi:MAG: cytochrome c [Kofleriaceae bacterium]